MSTDLDPMHDPEDEVNKTLTTGRKYTFNGVELEPYSSGRDDLMSRLCFDRMTRKEAAGLLVYICTRPAEKCVMIRTEKQVAEFLIEKGKWLDSLGWLTNPAIVAEALEVYGSITGDVDKAAEVQPDFSSATKVRGARAPKAKR